ncbi:enoyl-ACP reductase [bacterium]|nr:enoyl-ACP reductase [bacterium]
MLRNKRGLILGVANEFSLAAFISAKAHAAGADLGFNFLPDASSRGAKAEKRVRRVTDPLRPEFVFPCDLTSDESIDIFFTALQREWQHFDFMVHSVAWAPLADILCRTTDVSRAGFREAMDISVYSFLTAARRAAELMPRGGSIMTLSYYGGEKVVAGYNLMGVCKAALESAVRYASSELGPRGIRVNAISAGPVKTLSASAVGATGDSGGIDDMMRLHQLVSPLRRNITGGDVGDVACWLASDHAAAITGELIHADAGYNIMGGAPPDLHG